MAPVLFSIEWKRQVEDDMASGERMKSLHDMLIQLREPDFADSWPIVPAVTQRWGHRGYDWYDAAAIDEVVSLMDVGLLAVVTVSVGATPASDKERQINQERLGAIAPPFEAWFEGGPGDCDGTFEWDSPIELTQRQADGTDLRLRYEPSNVPLEVGHVAPETVPWHLRYEGGVARWPYGSESIVLMLTTGAFPGQTAGRTLRPAVIAGRRVVDDAHPRTSD